MGTYQLMNINETSPEYQGAMEIHRQILANGTIAASAMVELCRNLKLMRDKGAYVHLGYESFDDYCEEAANIKKRQAYNYISTYERLGPEVLQSNAQIGITKLQLLAQIPEETRAELLASGQAEELSSRQLKELTDELTKAREQISFLENDNLAVGENISRIADEKQAAQDRINELQKTIDKLTSDLKTETSKTKPAPVNEADIKKRLKEQADKEIAKAKADADRQIAAAREDGIKTGRASLERGLEAVEKEKAEALAKAAELEKKLKISGNQDTVLLTHLFTEFQDQFGKIMTCVGRIGAAVPDDGEKFKAAVKKLLAVMDQRI